LRLGETGAIGGCGTYALSKKGGAVVSDITEKACAWLRSPGKTK